VIRYRIPAVRDLPRMVSVAGALALGGYAVMLMAWSFVPSAADWCGVRLLRRRAG
jgi:hypothetical protein